MADGLDRSLTELSEEVDAIDQGAHAIVESLDILDSSNSLEEIKAEKEHEYVRENLPFVGFESSSEEEDENSATRKVSKVSKLVQNFEEALSASSESTSKGKSKKKNGKTKKKTGNILKKYRTRTAGNREDSSPLQALGPIRRKSRATSRKLQFGEMAEAADIKGSGRLNPRGRKIREAPQIQGFLELVTEDISGSGKIVIKRLDKLRTKIITNTQLVIRVGENTSALTELVADYITGLEKILIDFQKTPEDVTEDNAGGQALIEEMLNLESELESIKTYCKIHAEAPVRVEPIPVQKLKAQNFPKFDGTDDGTTYLNWKDQIEKLMPKIRDPDEKKNRLLDCLIKNAESFIKSIITPGMPYDTLMRKLESRYNDPLVMNSKLLHQVFFGKDFQESKSTLEHWDQAMQRIRALSDRGLTVEEVLLYYRLHRFEQNLVDKVMDRHRSLRPNDLKMSLDDAETIMNRIVNDEQKFKLDSITLDQEVQPMTFMTVPNVAPVATAAAAAITNSIKQSSPKTRRFTSKKFCSYCRLEDHHSDNCQKFPSATEKRAALKANGRCEDCKGKKVPNHRFFLNSICKFCNGWHRWQLCTKGDNEPYKLK